MDAAAAADADDLEISFTGIFGELGLEHTSSHTSPPRDDSSALKQP
jgi:hypothetical protein